MTTMTEPDTMPGNRQARLKILAERISQLDERRGEYAAERDKLIVEEVADGTSYSAIGNIAGMTKGNVHLIIAASRRAALNRKRR